MPMDISADYLTLDSPRFFELVAHEDWPQTGDALRIFLQLEPEDVRAIVKRTLRTSPRGRTWQGLEHVMEQKGYRQVSDLGADAATAWARHLGVIAPTAA